MSVFTPADILLPCDDISHELWSVVACDQFSSERSYWERVKDRVGESPSTLNMIIPEVYLEEIDEQGEIEKIRRTMERYVSDGTFREIKDSFIYVERTQPDGQVRKGLVGVLDLEEYDFSIGIIGENDSNDSKAECSNASADVEKSADLGVAAVLASEGTALDRLPPRIRVRQAASLELPHIMVLVADENQTVIEPLAAKSKELLPLYDFELMEGGGHLRGTQITGSDSLDVMKALNELNDSKKAEKPPRCFMIMGDGNHSLAAAKNYWDEIKVNLSPKETSTHPARFALVEVNNLFDPVICFEAIHRVVVDVDVDGFVWAISAELSADEGLENSQGSGCLEKSLSTFALKILSSGGEKSIAVAQSSASEVIAAVQGFLDEYIDEFGGRIDYIHGATALDSLVKDGNSVGILLPSITKQEFLETVALGRILPRKSFSIGHAEDKRYYMECRKLRDES